MTSFSASSRRRQCLGFEPMEERRLLALQVVDLASSPSISLKALEGGTIVLVSNDADFASVAFVNADRPHVILHVTVSGAVADSVTDPTQHVVSAYTIDGSAGTRLPTISPSNASEPEEGGHVPSPPVGLGGPATFRHLEAAVVATVAQPTRPAVRSEMARCVVLHVADRPAGQRPPSGIAAVVSGKSAPASRLVESASVAPAASKRPLAIADVRGFEPSGRKTVVPSAQNPVPKPRVPVAPVVMKNTSAIGTTILTPTSSVRGPIPEATMDHTDPAGDEASLIPPPDARESRWWIRLVATPAAAMIAVSGAWYVSRASRDRRSASHPMLRPKGLARIGGQAAS